MSKIVYYVASSIDGYISGPDDDVSQFIFEGKGVEKYQQDLAQFNTVIMGRRTYEFGYQYGLKPGQAAYPGMEHHIFSDSMKIDQLAENVHIEKRSIERVREIKNSAETDIYLCGGGQFAGWLLDNGLIDRVKLKLNPVILGNGTKLFGASGTVKNMTLISQESFDKGFMILTYHL